MRTVPASLASVLLAERADLRATINGCGRLVGTRVEVDLDAVTAAAGEGVADALTRLQDDTTALWADLGAGRGGRQYVVTSSKVAEHTQITGKVGRADLGEVFDALEQYGMLRGVLHQLTNPEVDEQALIEAVDAVGGSVRQDDEGSWVVRAPLQGGAVPDVLGGVRRPAQISREIELVAKHAKWRDRRVRRLAKVVVRNEEMWADPAPARALLAA